MNGRESTSIKPPVTLQHVMTFGKHKGLSIKTILRDDPEYIIWMAENDVQQING